MAVRIEDSCICCGACIDECPVEAIVDDMDNPNPDAGVYYVYEDKCVECVSHYEDPACAQACPTEGCFVWGLVAEKSTKTRGIEGEVVIK